RLNGLAAVGNLTVTAVRPAGPTEGPGVDARQFFAFIFPGLVIFGVMFISQSLALRLLRDRVRGVERRLMMTPLSPRAQIAGRFLPAEEMPAFLRDIAFVMPNGAAQQGFVDVLAHGRTLAEASGRIFVTWGWAVVMMAIAVASAQRRSGRA